MMGDLAVGAFALCRSTVRRSIASAGVSFTGWVGSNRLMLMPMCVRIVPDYRHGLGIATIANQEDMGHNGWVPLYWPSGRKDGLRPGIANYQGLVAWDGAGLLPWTLFT